MSMSNDKKRSGNPESLVNHCCACKGTENLLLFPVREPSKQYMIGFLFRCSRCMVNSQQISLMIEN